MQNGRMQGAGEAVNLEKESQVILLPKIPWVLHTSISRVWWAVENSLSPWAAGRMLCSRVSPPPPANACNLATSL